MHKPEFDPTIPEPRQGMPSPRLDETTFKACFLGQFVDPGFDDLDDELGRIVLSAACAASSPQRSCRAGKVKQADDYMARVRLGQTEQGSFVVTMLAPVPPAIEPKQADFWPTVQDEPFGRKVTRRLAGGLDAAAEAVESYILGGGMSAFDQTVALGVSANLCDAAAALSDRGDGVEVSVTWARTRPAPIQRWSRTFTRAEGEVLRSVSRSFREKQPRPDENLQGFITKLAREGADANAIGDVTLKAFVDDQWVSVSAKLAPDDYQMAIDAHKKVHPVRLHGTLERIGQRWALTNPSLIEIEDDESEAKE